MAQIIAWMPVRFLPFNISELLEGKNKKAGKLAFLFISLNPLI